MLKPEFFEEPNLDHDLMIFVCLKVGGIGKTTAAHIASHLETVAAFQSADASDLLAITRRGGKPLLKPEQADGILQMRKIYLPADATDLRQLWITALIRDFVARAIEDINGTDFDALLINPFLISAFRFTDPKEVITFCFYQKVTRSIVTSWGFTVERMLLVSGGSPTVGYDEIMRQSENRDMGFSPVCFAPNFTDEARDRFMTQEWRGVNADQRADIHRAMQQAEEIIAVSAPFRRAIEAKRRAFIEEWETRYGAGPASIAAALERRPLR